MRRDGSRLPPLVSLDHFPHEAETSDEGLESHVRIQNGCGATYCDNVKYVTDDKARRPLAVHIKSLVEEEPGSKSKTLRVGERIDLFLEWVQKSRSERSYSTPRTCYSRFASLCQGGHYTFIHRPPCIVRIRVFLPLQTASITMS